MRVVLYGIIGFLMFTSLSLATCNQAPYIPSDPSPSDGSVNQSLELTLKWKGGDPDGDSVEYDVYLQKDKIWYKPLFRTRNTSHTLSLDCSSTYYWWVLARDNRGEESVSPFWQFTTETCPPIPLPEWIKWRSTTTSGLAYAVVRSSDRAYGATGESGGKTYAEKLDINGAIIWRKTLPGDKGLAIAPTDDGGFVIAGKVGTTSKLLIRVDRDGAVLWNRTYDRGALDAVVPSPNGFLAAGQHIDIFKDGQNTWYRYSLFVMEIDGDGKVLWNRTYSGYATEIIRDSEGNWMIFGYTSYHMLVMKLDHKGNIVWQRIYKEDRFEYEHAYSATPTPDDGFIVSGRAELPPPRPTDPTRSIVSLRKIDREGKEIWHATPGSLGGIGESVIYTGDGAIVAGQVGVSRTKELLLLKISDEGKQIFAEHSIEGNCNDIVYSWDGGLIIAGTMRGEFLVAEIYGDPFMPIMENPPLAIIPILIALRVVCRKAPGQG